MKEILQAGSILAGQAKSSTPAATSLSQVLSARLVQYGIDGGTLADASEERLKWLTAEAALRVLVAVRAAFNALKPDGAPVFGSRDIKVLSVLASIVARWGLALMLDGNVLPEEFREGTKSKIGEQEARQLPEAIALVTRCLNLDQVEGAPVEPEELLNLLMPQFLPVYLPALLQWRRQGSKVADRLLDKVLNFVSPYVAMSMLMMLTKPSSAPWLITEASQLLSKQLLRHEGVYCLLKILVPDPDDQLSPGQMNLIFKLLTTPARDVTLEAHFNVVLPWIYTLIKWAAIKHYDQREWPVPPAILRCSAFVFAQLLAAGSPVAAPHILELLRSSFGLYQHEAGTSDEMDQTVLHPTRFREGLEILLTFLNNIPPTPNLVNEVLSPLLPLLVSLYMFVNPSESDARPPSLFKQDAGMKSNVETILATWLKTTPLKQLVLTFQKTLDGLANPDSLVIPERAYWAVAEDGAMCLRQPEGTEETVHPPWSEVDQLSLIGLLQKEGMPETRAALLVRWIGELEEPDRRDRPEAIALKMQLLLQGLGIWGPSTLQDPSQLLAFVAFTLKGRTADEEPEEQLGRLNMADEDLDPETGLPEQEQMHTTGLTLLLALLEGHRDLNETSQPILKIVRARISPLAKADSSVAGLAREAQTVLQLRQSAVTVAKPAKNDPLAESRQLYVESLRLLEDPILPVKAQGLAQLRSLIGNDLADPALYEGILDAFIQFVDNDDSFLYLSAVDGLSNLAVYKPQTEGRRVAQKLMDIYAGSEKAFSERKLDRKLRVGEAVSHLVQGTTSAVAIYIDIIVPSLLDMLRNNRLQSVLRASSLTVLATCVEASPLALLPYSETIIDACLTLLTLESRPSPMMGSESPTDGSNTGKRKRNEETPDALTTDTKHPGLRRGALLSIALQARAQRTFDGTRKQVATNFFPAMLLAKAKTVVRYVQEVDGDELVRYQASETLEELDALLPVVDLE